MYQHQIFSILCFTYNNKSSNITTLGLQMVHLAPTPKKVWVSEMFSHFSCFERELRQPFSFAKRCNWICFAFCSKIQELWGKLSFQNMYWYILISYKNTCIVSILRVFYEVGQWSKPANMSNFCTKYELLVTPIHLES